MWPILEENDSEMTESSLRNRPLTDIWFIEMERPIAGPFCGPLTDRGEPRLIDFDETIETIDACSIEERDSLGPKTP